MSKIIGKISDAGLKIETTILGAGPQGPQGLPGEAGPQGEKGDKGDKGEKGDPADLTIATDTILGGIKVGENLKIDGNGVLSVDTTANVSQDNTKPVTSAAVHVQLGNVETLLAAL